MKTLNTNLPTIGILIFEGVLANEIVAPLDVFSRKDPMDHALFNVVLIAKEARKYVTEEGLKIFSDYTFDNVPKLNVLVVPGSNEPERQTADKLLIEFIKEQHETADYIASHCAGAFMLGESGIADNKQIVTYCSGHKKLQGDYPGLQVMDDRLFSVVQDEKIISSNGNLVSYLGSLDLLELMTGTAQRRYVERQLLLDKLTKEKPENHGHQY